MAPTTFLFFCVLTPLSSSFIVSLGDGDSGRLGKAVPHPEGLWQSQTTFAPSRDALGPNRQQAAALPFLLVHSQEHGPGSLPSLRISIS